MKKKEIAGSWIRPGTPKTLHLTVGLPRSGKSSWAKEAGYPIVNRDSIRYAIGGSIRYFSEENKVSKMEELMVKALFKAGHDDIIVDSTHLKQKYIDRWEEFATTPIWSPHKDNREVQESNFEIVLATFATPLVVCMERAKKDFPEDTKFPEIIKSMWESAETIDIPTGVPLNHLNQTLGYMRLIKGDL